LAEKGLRNRLGNPPGISAIHRMLRNPIYAGVVRWKGVEREGTHPSLVSRALYDKVQMVLDALSSGGERSWKHDHYLKDTLVCAECSSKMYYAVAKSRFGYFRCVGRNTRRTRCSQGRYVPAAVLEREVEVLYEGIRIPTRLKRRLERVLRTEVAERERLLRAYYADAIDVQTLKREQARINGEVAEAESQLATDGDRLKQAKEIIDLALDLARDCAASYRKAKPEVRRMWIRAFFGAIRVRGRQDRGLHVRRSFRVAPWFTQGLNGGPKGTLFELVAATHHRVPWPTYRHASPHLTSDWSVDLPAEIATRSGGSGPGQWRPSNPT
jgi:site-specific DNA recombinase